MKIIKHALFAAGLLFCATTFAQHLPGSPNQADMRIDPAQRQALIDGIIGELHKNYVFPEQANKIDAALRQHQKRGDYAAITSAEKLSQTLTAHLQAVNNDKHLNVFYS